MKKTCIIVSAILLVAYASLQFFECCPASVKLPCLRKKQVASLSVEDKAKLREQIHQLVSDYQRDCEEYLQDFCRILEAQTEQDFRLAKAAVPETVDKFCKFSVCCKLCYKAAKDKLMDTHDFNDAVMEIMRDPIIQPCIHASEVANNALQNLEQQLKERKSKLSVDLATAGSNMDVEPVLSEEEFLALQKYVDDTASQVQQIAMDTVLTTIGAALEVVFIRQTCSIALKLLAKSVAKLTTSVGMGALCAIADGPLPIGDVIGAVIVVGGLVWTIYDIYQAVKVFPQELRNGMTAGIDEIQRRLNEEMKAKAQKLLTDWRASGTAMEEKLCTQLQ